MSRIVTHDGARTVSPDWSISIPIERRRARNRRLARIRPHEVAIESEQLARDSSCQFSSLLFVALIVLAACSSSNKITQVDPSSVQLNSSNKSDPEFEKIIEILGRTPNFTELSIFSVMWSEHCSYKNSINWLKSIGINTFTGTSGRVFPEKNIKPIEVLNAILEMLKKKNVSIKTNYLWKGWNEESELQFETKNEIETVKADFVVFALGGKSWRITGSDGDWMNYFSEKEIEIVPFEASNCAIKIDWKTDFLKIEEL